MIISTHIAGMLPIDNIHTVILDSSWYRVVWRLWPNEQFTRVNHDLAIRHWAYRCTCTKRGYSMSHNRTHTRMSLYYKVGALPLLPVIRTTYVYVLQQVAQIWQRPREVWRKCVKSAILRGWVTLMLHFRLKGYVSCQYLWTVRWGNDNTTTLPLEVSTYRNFVS